MVAYVRISFLLRAERWSLLCEWTTMRVPIHPLLEKGGVMVHV